MAALVFFFVCVRVCVYPGTRSVSSFFEIPASENERDSKNTIYLFFFF